MIESATNIKSGLTPALGKLLHSLLKFGQGFAARVELLVVQRSLRGVVTVRDWMCRSGTF